MHMDVFHEHRAFVDQHAHRKCQAAQSHNVDRLPSEAQQHYRHQQCKWNSDDHDEGTPPVTEEEQDHQTCEASSDQTFAQHREKSSAYVLRLIKFISDLDVWRDE